MVFGSALLFTEVSRNWPDLFTPWTTSDFSEMKQAHLMAAMTQPAQRLATLRLFSHCCLFSHCSFYWSWVKGEEEEWVAEKLHISLLVFNNLEELALTVCSGFIVGFWLASCLFLPIALYLFGEPSTYKQFLLWAADFLSCPHGYLQDLNHINQFRFIVSHPAVVAIMVVWGYAELIVSYWFFQSSYLGSLH